MEITEIANKINNVGGRLYLVGGAVRDRFLGIEPKDYDYVITGLTNEKFIELFPKGNIRGKSFPVYDMYGAEFALARIEKKIDKGYKGFEITSNAEITIEQDLKRRDVTINSIAIDVLSEEVVDPFEGRKDIENKILRATRENDNIQGNSHKVIR